MKHAALHFGGLWLPPTFAPEPVWTTHRELPSAATKCRFNTWNQLQTLYLLRFKKTTVYSDSDTVRICIWVKIEITEQCKPLAGRGLFNSDLISTARYHKLHISLKGLDNLFSIMTPPLSSDPRTGQGKVPKYLPLCFTRLNNNVTTVNAIQVQ